jgi:dynein heavy chain
MIEAGDALDPTTRLLQGPPAMAMTGFEGGHCVNQKNLEMARSKFLLDKLTNKLPPELLSASRRKLPPIDREVGSAMRTSGQELNTQPKVPPVTDNIIGGEEKKPKEVVQQQWSDLDKFIELLLDSKSDEETVFLYLNPNKKTGDPYDLLLTEYRDRQIPRYYTLSGKGLTLYENDMPIEFIQLGQWLIERDSYNQIKELKFFKQFKKWKFWRMWNKTIKRENRVKAQNALEEKLFFLQPTFDTHLMKHRKLMIDMEHGKRFVDECENSGGDTKRIEEFANEQLKKTEQVVEEIKRMSQKSRLNIQECITEVLSVRRSLILSEISLDEKNRKTLPGNQSQAASLKKKEAKDDHDNLGFPEGMTYGHRHALRLECGRFLRFAFLVDFLALESLTNIYLNSVESMTRRLQKLNESCDIMAICAAESGDDSAALTAPRGLEPLFYVEIKLDEKPIPETMEVTQ